VTAFIIVAIVSAVFAIVAYQVFIHKYYWGPQGPPKKKNTKDLRK
jgi:hypothetical protein